MLKWHFQNPLFNQFVYIYLHQDLFYLTHCNGAKKWVDKIIEQAATVTLAQKLAEPFYEQVGKKGQEFDSTQMQALLNLHVQCHPNPQAPKLLNLAVQTFPEMGLPGLSKHFELLYSQTPEKNDQPEESFSKRKQKRIIGDQMQKVYRHGTKLLRCLKPNGAFSKKLHQVKKRCGLHLYLHCLKVVFVIHSSFCMEVELEDLRFGAKFVGVLFILE